MRLYQEGEPERAARFTNRSREVLERSLTLAQSYNHGYIGTEHLLLGLVAADPTDPAMQTLEHMRVDVKKVHRSIEFIIGRVERDTPSSIGLTPRAKLVIQLTDEEAQMLEETDIGTEHLLLGLIREGDGIAARVLESEGINLNRAREVIRRTRDPQI